MVRRVDRRRWLIRALLVGLAAAGVGIGCRTSRNGAEMTQPRPLFSDKDAALGPKGGLMAPNTNP